MPWEGIEARIDAREHLHVFRERGSYRVLAPADLPHDRISALSTPSTTRRGDQQESDLRPIVHVPRPVSPRRIRDRLMLPIMKLLGGSFSECAQETHPWNVEHLSDRDQRLLYHRLDKKHTVRLNGTHEGYVARMKPGIMQSIFMHAPLVGGYRDYGVMRASLPPGKRWHIGWYSENALGVRGMTMSRLPLADPEVRMLRGKVGEIVTFFAIDEDGKQIPLTLSGTGRLGRKKDTQRYGATRLL